MNKVQCLLLIATLVAASNSFKLKRLSNTLKDNLTVENRLDMPCAILTTQIYKAFQLYGLQTPAPRENQFEYQGIQATLYWNMCSSVSYDSECPEMPIPANYGYVKADVPQ